MSNHQIENSYFQEKLALRLNFLPNKNNIKVLDCYCADGKIWNTIKNKLPDKNFSICNIDVKKTKIINLIGDNLKFLSSMDLSVYDIIDLDAYGMPVKQLDIISIKKPKAEIFITFIPSIYGCLHRNILFSNGFSNSMIRKIPTLFYKNPFEKFKNYLEKLGINKITYINKDNKYYIHGRFS